MCPFCSIAIGEHQAWIVYEDELCLAFLDIKPLFPGHLLLIPREHFATLADLPKPLLNHLFENAQMLSVAVEQAMQAEGTFVAMNNKISQSVPHFHVHIVPRRKGDGLKGFFWPRTKYESDKDAAVVRDAIRATLDAIRKS